MKRLAASLAALFFLSACATSVEWGAISELANQDGDIVPRMATSSTLKTFDKYCYQNRGNIPAVKRALEKDGYLLAIQRKRDGYQGFAYVNRPFVSLITNDGGTSCSVMVKRDPNLAAAANRFVRSKHKRVEAVGRSAKLEQLWIVKRRPLVSYALYAEDGDQVLMLNIN
ncbi:MAG: hypothetical protein HKN27_02990 [Silicimonas sp.]|nr:hypothetical protein [Silicimonas sp.]